MNEDQDVKKNPEVAPETKANLEETAAPVETSFATPPAKKRPLKLIIAALIAAVLVVLIGGSVFGYTMWYQNPDKVVHDAVIHAIKAETVSSKGTITYNSEDVKMDITLDSKSADGNGDFTIAAKVTINSEQMKQDFNATGTGRIVDDTLYVKVSGIRDVVEDTAAGSFGAIPEYATSIFEKIEDRWISIKPTDYQEVSEDIASQQTCLLDLMEKIQSNSTMSDEVADLYRDNQILVVEEELGSKDIDGVDSFGYRISFDQDAAASFTSELEKTAFGKELKKCNEDIDFTEITKDINQEVSESEDEPVTELWVSKLGHEITEVAVYGHNSGTDELNITLQPSFNDDITVEVPEGATSLKTVLGEIQEAIMNYQQGTPSSEATVPSGFDMGDIDPELQSVI